MSIKNCNSVYSWNRWSILNSKLKLKSNFVIVEVRAHTYLIYYSFSLNKSSHVILVVAKKLKRLMFTFIVQIVTFNPKGQTEVRIKLFYSSKKSSCVIPRKNALSFIDNTNKIVNAVFQTKALTNDIF